jgi:hypothetical protein
MAKSALRTTDRVASTAADRSTTRASTRPAPVTDRDIACRAYDLYLARGGGHGHDIDDWLLAERQLRMR